MCPLIIRCYRWSLFCLLLVLVLIKPTCEGACQWDHCSRDFEVASARSDQEEGTDPWMLCRALQTHIICLRSLSKPCRGNLHYYSYVKGVTRVEDKTNCSHELETNLSTRQDNRTHKPLSTTVEPFLILPAFHGCSTINLTSDMKYCSVFGDLHIITGSGVFETCKIVGAYPLIENRYLAVQISSKNIRRSSYSVTVSSISRVTVIIKASECLEERKTYEASLGHLPQIFTDYTTESENNPSSYNTKRA
ncbi:putative Repulsive guidance molecule A [Hypsibius exemplaris]|uniref:Repulsive guidance molecule A n=1 Tax=Hypsibius exemplaris TaxID=2072580 RepID=A0A1W0WK03_HYPEX|nr:putative Repulsive guidance molecule A [Hypsibius exemplaris]